MASVDEVRDEARTWLEEHWHRERPLIEWRNLLADTGWGTPSWPTEWHGRGLPPSMDAVVAREFDAVGAVGVAAGVSMYLVAPTLLTHANDDQKRRHLRPILTGEHKWCQLFSEPTNGSDLAGLVTRADRDGDEWIVNGQKVWNSGAHKARFGILMARTNWDVPKHQGISYFLIPMDQPGVEVRPLRQMNGHATFNEVFFEGARVPGNELVGNPGDGWRIGLTTLTHERAAVATRRPRYPADGGPTVERAKQESDEYFATYNWYPQRAGRANLVVPEAQRTGRGSDAVIRQQIALIDSMTKRERANPRILQASRKKRVAAGAGLEVSDLNRLLKMHRQMSDMMKKVGRMGKKGMMSQLGGLAGGGGAMAGGMPGKAEIEAAQRQLGRLPGGLAGLGDDSGGQFPPGISGLGKKQ